jgi:hypothetical protein
MIPLKLCCVPLKPTVVVAFAPAADEYQYHADIPTFVVAATVEVAWLMSVQVPLPVMLLGFKAVVPEATPFVCTRRYIVFAAGVHAARAYDEASVADDRVLTDASVGASPMICKACSVSPSSMSQRGRMNVGVPTAMVWSMTLLVASLMLPIEQRTR